MFLWLISMPGPISSFIVPIPANDKNKLPNPGVSMRSYGISLQIYNGKMNER